MQITKSKSRALSTISTDIAQVFFAASIGAILLPLDAARILVVILELGFAIIFWIFSVLFAERGRL